jgi:hypothetical protein
MKLDRNTNKDGTGKYAIVKMRVIKELDGELEAEVRKALALLDRLGILDYGADDHTAFFPIRLKDKYAAAALGAYGMAAWEDDREYAMEVLNLAMKAATHPGKRKPD